MHSVESPAGVVTLLGSWEGNLVQFPSLSDGNLGVFNKMLNTSDLDQAFPLLGIHYGAIPAYRIRRLYKIFIITFLNSENSKQPKCEYRNRILCRIKYICTF